MSTVRVEGYLPTVCTQVQGEKLRSHKLYEKIRVNSWRYRRENIDLIMLESIRYWCQRCYWYCRYPPLLLRTVEPEVLFSTSLLQSFSNTLNNHSLVDWVRTLMGSSFPGSTLSWSMIPADTGVSLSNASCRLMVDDTFSSVQKQGYRSTVRTTWFTVQRLA